MSSAAALVVRDLCLERGGRIFCRVPDLEASAGETLAIIGPSGSGKSTALMAIAGIRSPARGRVLIEGIDPWCLKRRERDRFRGQRIGIIFQSFHLIDALTVRANVSLASSCAGLSTDERQRVAELLARLDVSGIAEQRADRISQGQAQRVAVARALLNKPAVLLADEPTSALDDTHATALLDLLREAAMSVPASLVIATHDRRVLDRVGRVVEMQAVE